MATAGTMGPGHSPSSGWEELPAGEEGQRSHMPVTLTEQLPTARGAATRQHQLQPLSGKSFTHSVDSPGPEGRRGVTSRKRSQHGGPRSTGQVGFRRSSRSRKARGTFRETESQGNKERPVEWEPGLIWLWGSGSGDPRVGPRMATRGEEGRAGGEGSDGSTCTDYIYGREALHRGPGGDHRDGGQGAPPLPGTRAACGAFTERLQGGRAHEATLSLAGQAHGHVI